MFNKDVKVPLQEAELVGTSSSNNFLVAIIDRIDDLEVIYTHKFSPIRCNII